MRGTIVGVIVGILLIALVHIPANCFGIPDMVGIGMWYIISVLVGLPIGVIAFKVGESVEESYRG